MKKLFLIAFMLTACGEVATSNQGSAAQIVSHATIEVEMHCGGCEGTIKTALGALAGVQSVTASHKDKKVVVTFDSSKLTLDAIKEAIKGLGYTVS
jgi:copper chaperone CopZ